MYCLNVLWVAECSHLWKLLHNVGLQGGRIYLGLTFHVTLDWRGWRGQPGFWQCAYTSWPLAYSHPAPFLSLLGRTCWCGCLSSLLSPLCRIRSWDGLKWSEVAQSCPTLCNPMDCNLPGSIHGIFQARILEWVAISFPSPDPGIEPGSPALQADALLSEPPGKPLGWLRRVLRMRSVRPLLGVGRGWEAWPHFGSH